MGTVAADEREIYSVIYKVIKLQSVLDSLPTEHSGHATLSEVIDSLLTQAPGVRVRTAAGLLQLDPKTVRAWHREGVLKASRTEPRLLLELSSVWQVTRLVQDLRAAGKTHGLLDEVWRRLVDASWLDRGDLVESLEQMRRGEGISDLPSDEANG